MSVTNGQIANQTTFNNAFMSRTANTTSTVAVVALNNVLNVNSGAAVANVQQALNETFDAEGMTGIGDATRKTYSSNEVVSDGDDKKVAIGKLDLEFSNTFGHDHSGAPGNGKPISAFNLLNINQLFAVYQEFAITGASGASTDISTQMTGKTPNGSSSAKGVITNPPSNLAFLVDTTDYTFVEDSMGDRVYGRLTESAGVWTITYYTSGDVPYSLTSTDVKVIFFEVFDLEDRPTIPSNPFEFGTLDVTGDVVDASATLRGVVNTIAQTFQGAKTFLAMLTMQAQFVGAVETDNTTTGTGASIAAISKIIHELTNVSLVSVNDITSVVANQLFFITNKTGGTVVIVHNFGAGGFFVGSGSDMQLFDGASILCYYDAGSSRVRIVGGAGGPQFNLAAFGSTPNAFGATYNNITGAFNLEPADMTHPGVVAPIAQVWSGDKEFVDDVTLDSRLFGATVDDAVSTGIDAIVPPPAKMILRMTDPSLESILQFSSSPTDPQVFMLINATGRDFDVKNNNAVTDDIITGTGEDLTLADGASLWIVRDITGDRWRVVGGSGSGGGSASLHKNYAPKGGRFAGGTTGWSVFNTVFSGNVPNNITPGSSNVAISHETANPLSFPGSLKFDVTTAAGAAGHGFISDIMTIDDQDLAKVFEIAMDYYVSAGASSFDYSGTGTHSLELWVYNVGLNSWYQPQNFRGINGLGHQGVNAYFQTDASNASNKNQYRLAVILRNDPSGTATVIFDSVGFQYTKESKVFNRTTTLKLYQTIPQTLPNAVDTKIEYDLVGFDDDGLWDPANFWVKFKEPGTYRVSFLTQYDPNSTGVRQISMSGTGIVPSEALYFKDATASGNTLFLTGSNTFKANAGDTMWGSAYQATSGTLGIAPNGAFYNHFSLEKIGSIDTVIAGDDVALNVTGAPTSTLSGVASPLALPNVIIADGLTYNPSTGETTILKPCRLVWTVAVGVQQTFGTNQSVVLGLYKNGSLLRDLIWRGYSGADFLNPTLTYPPFDFVTGDIVTIQVNTDVVSPAYYTGGDLHSIGAFKVGGVQLINPGRSVKMKASGASNTIPTGALTGVENYATVVKDTSGGMDAVSGLFTVKDPGDFWVDFEGTLTGAFNANGFVEITIAKNGITSLLKQTRTGATSASDCSCSGLVEDCVAGDVINVEIQTDATSPAFFQTFFSLFRVP